MAKDIELTYPGMTTALLRELAGIRTRVPSNRTGWNSEAVKEPPCPIEVQDRLRERVYELAKAIVDGGSMPRNKGSIAASERWAR